MNSSRGNKKLMVSNANLLEMQRTHGIYRGCAAGWNEVCQKTYQSHAYTTAP